MELNIDNTNRPEFSAMLNKLNTLDETTFSLESSESLKQLYGLLTCGFNVQNLKAFFSNLPFGKINIYIKNIVGYYLIGSFDNTDTTLPVGNFVYSQNNKVININSFDITNVNPTNIVNKQSLQPVNYLLEGANMANYRIYHNYFLSFLKELNNISSDAFDVYGNTFKETVHYFVEDLEGNPKLKDNKLINSFILSSSIPYLHIKIFTIKFDLNYSDYEINFYRHSVNIDDNIPSILEDSRTLLELIESIKTNTTAETINDELLRCYSNTQDIKYLQLLKIYNNFNKDDYSNDRTLSSYTQQYYINMDSFENFKYNRKIYSDKKLVFYWFIWDLVLLYFLFNPTQKLLLLFSPSTQYLFYDIYFSDFIINSKLLQNKNITYLPQSINYLYTINHLHKTEHLDELKQLFCQIDNNRFLHNLSKLSPIQKSELMSSDIILPLSAESNKSIAYDLLFSNYLVTKVKLLSNAQVINSFNFTYYFNLVVLYNQDLSVVKLLYNLFMGLFATSENRIINIPRILSDYNSNETSQTLAAKTFQKSVFFEALVMNIVNNPNPKIKALCDFTISDETRIISNAMRIFNYVRNTTLLNYYYQNNGFNRDLMVQSLERSASGEIQTELFIIQTIKNDWYEGLVKIAEQTGGLNDVFRHLIKNNLLDLTMFKISSSNYCKYINLYFDQLKKLDFKIQKHKLIDSNKIIEILNNCKDTILSDEDVENIKCLIDIYVAFILNLQSTDKSASTKWLTVKETKTFLNAKTSDGYNLYHLAVLINNAELINYIFTELETKIKLSISIKELDNEEQNLFFLIKDYRILELLLTKPQFQNRTLLEEMFQKVNSGNHGLISAWYNNNDTSRNIVELLRLTLRYFNYNSSTIIPGFYRNITSIILTNVFENFQELFLVLQEHNLLDANIRDLVFLFENKMLINLSQEEKARFIRIYNTCDSNGTMESILEYCIQNEKDNTVLNFLLLVPNALLIKYYLVFINNNYDLMKIVMFFNKEVIMEQYKSGKSILHFVAENAMNNEKNFLLFRYLFQRLDSEDITALKIVKSLCELPNITKSVYDNNRKHVLDVLTVIYKLITTMSVEALNEDYGNYKLIHVIFGNGRSITWQNIGMYLNIYYYLYSKTTPMPSFVPYHGYNDNSSGSKIRVDTFAENDFDCDLVPEEANKEGLPILEHYLTVPLISELEKNHFSYSYKI